MAGESGRKANTTDEEWVEECDAFCATVDRIAAIRECEACGHRSSGVGRLLFRGKWLCPPCRERALDELVELLRRQ